MAHVTIIPITTDPTLQLIRDDENPGGLTVRTWDTNDPRSQEVTLTPSEADQLVLHALGMTKPRGVESSIYKDAVNAVRTWQRKAAEIVRRESLDAERNQILKDAGFLVGYKDLVTDPVRALVDQAIAERRKAEQK